MGQTAQAFYLLSGLADGFGSIGACLNRNEMSGPFLWLKRGINEFSFKRWG